MSDFTSRPQYTSENLAADLYTIEQHIQGGTVDAEVSFKAFLAGIAWARSQPNVVTMAYGIHHLREHKECATLPRECFLNDSAYANYKKNRRAS